MCNYIARDFMLLVWKYLHFVHAAFILLPDIKISIILRNGVLITLRSYQIVIKYMAFHTGAEDVFSLQHCRNRLCIISLYIAVTVLRFRNLFENLALSGVFRQVFP